MAHLRTPSPHHSIHAARRPAHLAVAAAVACLVMLAAGAVGGAPAPPPGKTHWAFLPPRSAPVPRVKAQGRVRTPVDAFLLARLETQGLTFSPDAPKSVMLRRVSFDLTGLPPTAAELYAFLADPSPGAYERVVDRLLASPQFGVRWATHWLDAAGYVDTTGSDNDAAIMKQRENAWRYRDYVVDSLNADVPFDRFLTEQLAGDELYPWRDAVELTPPMTRALIATGFLRTAGDDTDQPEQHAHDDYGQYSAAEDHRRWRPAPRRLGLGRPPYPCQ